MRTLLLTALAALSLTAAACTRENEGDQPDRPRGSTVIEPETRVDVVPQEEPAVARTQWRAASDTARRVSGNLRVSIETTRGGPVIFAFANGITVRAQPYNMVPADSRSGVGGQSFAAVLGGDPRVNAYLYRVLDENVTRSAAQGGLCGEERTRYMAVSEFVDGSGRWVFKIAAFRGSEAPPSSEDPQVCNSYAYIAQ
ncbi:MAG TPA: hypothetical protein VEF55_02200 [Candidatus Binatia bacterium]|nr:hypothetical protein [Candidatus Binatia bacterium]